MLLHKFSNKYIIQGTLYAKTPIHIGSGKENLTLVSGYGGSESQREPFTGKFLKRGNPPYIEKFPK